MPAYRCSICSLNYPPNVGFRVCVNCDEKLDYMTNVDQDDDWRKSLEYKRAGIDLPASHGAVPTGAEIVDRSVGSPHPANSSATVIYRNDTDTVVVHDKELRGLGYLPEPFDVVRLNGKYYELLDFNPESRFWTIEGIDVYNWLALLDAEFPLHEGPSSDDMRQVEIDGYMVWWDPRVNGDSP